MARIRIRGFQRLAYRDPRAVLVELRRIEMGMVGADIDERVRHLRTNALRSIRELRTACLFCYGMSQVTGQQFEVAHSESADYDAVATWVKGDLRSFAPIQIKEVPPVKLNTTASVQQVVDGLAKYKSSDDLTVAIYLNRVV